MPDSRALARPKLIWSQFISKLAAGLVTLVGLMVLIGWIGGVSNFKSVYGPITMKANAGLGLIVGGISLFFLTSNQKQFKLVSQVCATFIALLGIATLSEHIFGRNL